MTGSAKSEVCRSVLAVALVLMVAGLAWTLVLAGCGSDEAAPGTGGDLVSGDVLLFPAEEPPAEKLVRMEADKDVDLTLKAVLPDSGAFFYFNPLEFDVDFHRFTTVNGVAYLVEICATGSVLDDVDLYIGRDPDPYINWDFVSCRFDPKMDSIVFRSNQDGTMHIAVQGWDDGDSSGSCPYTIHVRRARFGTNTG